MAGKSGRKVDRYADLPDGGHSEYGGGEVPQRYPGGGSVPLQDVQDTKAVSARARLMRQAGMNDYDPDPTSDLTVGELNAVDVSNMSPAQKAAYEADVVLARERAIRRASLQERTNGYIDEPSQYIGEPVSADPASGTSPAPPVTGDFSTGGGL